MIELLSQVTTTPVVVYDWTPFAVAVIAAIFAGASSLLQVWLSSSREERRKVIDAKTGEDIKLLEKNTNSIKDALIAAVSKAEFARGKEDQRAETDARNLIESEAMARGAAIVNKTPDPVPVVVENPPSDPVPTTAIRKQHPLYPPS